MTKPGYIYVLTHPSDPNPYKVGVTILDPRQRLAQHNKHLSKAAGQVVKETGKKWELKEYHAVPDPYLAESAFWGATQFADIPYLDGIEVQRMSWEEVSRGLEAAKKAGHRSLPKPLPVHVHAYTASMMKRLEGRGITLLGYVKSMGGKSNFRCSNGHEWRTRSLFVAEGDGCPQCGTGEMIEHEIKKMVNAGTICLLTHPDKPGFIKIGVEHARFEEAYQERSCEGWQTHRFRNIQEDVDFAEIIIWKLLGHPLPHNREPIEMDLSIAEQAFRNLIDAIRREVAIVERRKENSEQVLDMLYVEPI